MIDKKLHRKWKNEQHKPNKNQKVSLSCEQGMTFIIIQLIKPFTRRWNLYSYVLVLWKFNDACLDFELFLIFD